jgi:uncharacterized membrane protein
VLGIAGVVTALFLIGGLIGVVGLILGVAALQRAGRSQDAGRTMAILGTVLSAIAIVGAVLVTAVGFSFVKSHRSQFQNFTQCVQQATTPAERQDCARQFRQDMVSPQP